MSSRPRLATIPRQPIKPVDLLVKPNDSVGRLYKAGIDQIDNHVEEKCDRGGLAAFSAGFVHIARLLFGLDLHFVYLPGTSS
jgi:hypothetical protein